MGKQIDGRPAKSDKASSSILEEYKHLKGQFLCSLCGLLKVIGNST
jgi:hypothetical protein